MCSGSAVSTPPGAERSVSGPPGLGTYVPTSVRLVSQSLPGWMRYPGTWGEKEYINLTVNGSVIRSGPHGFSPLGPEHGNRLGGLIHEYHLAA